MNQRRIGIVILVVLGIGLSVEAPRIWERVNTKVNVFTEEDGTVNYDSVVRWGPRKHKRHGRSYRVWPNGQLAWEAEYDYGEKVSLLHQQWFVAADQVHG